MTTPTTCDLCEERSIRLNQAETLLRDALAALAMWTATPGTSHVPRRRLTEEFVQQARDFLEN